MEADPIVKVCVIALVIYSTSLHEMGHAFVASWLGDPTPGRYGRLTLNPIPHLSPPLTAIVFPTVFYLIGGGLFCLAMTPVNPSRMRYPLRDYALTSLAGPVTNFLFAGILLGILWIPGVWQYPPVYIMAVLTRAAWWCLVLGLFNLLPIPPLDGYGILRVVLPLPLRQQGDALARMGMMSLVIVMMVGSAVFGYIEAPLAALYVRLLPSG
ncbi:MAG: site-2 protease family protein [Planctomycetota bacterium]|nr:site-2 protease family protein [Planctomycetota bacterium]